MNISWDDFHAQILEWYQHNHRPLRWRATQNPYYIWLSEIMLQQTRVEAVKNYYDRFLKEIPDIEALANVSEEKLLKLWEGLGYYNRARNLKKAACVVMEQYKGIFPSDYTDVISLPGIGEYTAGAICSICYGAKTPAVDGNVLRVMMRIFECYDNIDDVKTKRKVREQLLDLYKLGECGQLTQALMELGAVVCVPNGTPHCDACPMQALCKAYQNHTFQDLPVRAPKKKRKIIHKTVFILHDNDCYAIRQRDGEGMLANMWEFMNVDDDLEKQQALDYISKLGYGPVSIEQQILYTHVFTHVEWRMVAYYISCRNQLSDMLWVNRKELVERYALPTAFRVFLENETIEEV